MQPWPLQHRECTYQTLVRPSVLPKIAKHAAMLDESQPYQLHAPLLTGIATNYQIKGYLYAIIQGMTSE